MREHEDYESEPVRERIHEEVPHDVVHERPVVRDSGPSWTSYALVKYGFILVMVVIILYFIAQFVLPLLP